MSLWASSQGSTGAVFPGSVSRALSRQSRRRKWALSPVVRTAAPHTGIPGLHSWLWRLLQQCRPPRGQQRGAKGLASCHEGGIPGLHSQLQAICRQLGSEPADGSLLPLCPPPSFYLSKWKRSFNQSRPGSDQELPAPGAVAVSTAQPPHHPDVYWATHCIHFFIWEK